MKRSALGLVVVTLAFAACGGGDDAKSTGKTKSAEKGEAGESGETMHCGAEVCKLPSSLKGMELCCRDHFSSGGCGVKMGANCRELPKVDERCPVPELNVMVPGMGNIVQQTFGCCTTKNECGIDFGSGCQPRTFACMFVNAEQADKIKPQTCDGKDMPLPPDCGMNPITFRPPGSAGAGM